MMFWMRLNEVAYGMVRALNGENNIMGKNVGK